MAIISQHAIKSGFFVISGRNNGEIEGEFHYYLKKQSQFVKGQNERKVTYNKRLWLFRRSEAAEKQSQFEANLPASGRKS